MKFVSRFDDYQHQVQAGTMEYRQGAGGTVIQVATSPLLVATFTRGVLSAAEREACRQYFDTRGSGQFSGEQPGLQRHDGVFSEGIDGSIMGGGSGEFYSGSKWEFMYSVFDTSDPTACPPEYREAFEAVLTADGEACRRISEEKGFLGAWALSPTTDIRAGDLVCLDTLMAERTAVETDTGVVVTRKAADAPRWEPNFPWPKFDEITGPPAAQAKTIADTCELIGLDKQRVAQYVIEHKAQKTVVAKLLGVSNEKAQQRIDAHKNAPKLPVIEEAPLPPTNLLPAEDRAPNQLDAAPANALSDGIRFGDFVQ